MARTTIATAVRWGMWTSGTGLAAAGYATLVATGVGPIPQPSPDGLSPVLDVATVLAVVVAALGSWWAAGRVLAEGGARVAHRSAALAPFLVGYGLAAAVVAVVPLDTESAGLSFGALAMTAPGVAVVVLDGSSVGRGTVRVLVAATLVPVAGVAGLLVGYVAVFIASIVGSVVAGLVVGHLVTFVPLAVIGPGGGGGRGRGLLATTRT